MRPVDARKPDEGCSEPKANGSCAKAKSCQRNKRYQSLNGISAKAFSASGSRAETIESVNLRRRKLAPFLSRHPQNWVASTNNRKGSESCQFTRPQPKTAKARSFCHIWSVMRG